nr:tiorf82 [Agrobacterium tumefaciens]
MTRFAAGHTKEVAARHYADVPALRPLHEATIADAFTEAVTSALSSTVLTPEQEETWRNDPVAASKAAPEGCDPMSLLDGKQDIWLASCGGFFSSPYAEHGSPCSQPFWGCLECPNAVITTRKLPAILSFLAFLEGQRLLLSASHWATKFATAHARITMQILPAFGSATVEEARRVLASEPVSNYMPPEALL